jgi:hypothetical protein
MHHSEQHMHAEHMHEVHSTHSYTCHQKCFRCSTTNSAPWLYCGVVFFFVGLDVDESMCSQDLKNLALQERNLPRKWVLVAAEHEWAA